MTAPAPSVPTRYRLIDALRGFAIAGIIFVNIPDMTRFGMALEVRHPDAAETVLNLAVQTRFLPIFELLFGAGMWFIVQSARRRGVSPWLAMVLRLATLLVIGIALSVVYRGEILKHYAFFGLVLLPLVVLAPRWLLLGLGAALEAVILVLAGSSAFETSGLLLLGAAAAAYGVPAWLERGGRPVLYAFLGAVLLAVPALAQQVIEGAFRDPRFMIGGGRAGFVVAIVYVTGLALLWSTPARRVISAVFEPLGRMALTNYVSAALVVVPIGILLRFPEHTTLTAPLLLGAAVIAVQMVVSRIWLRYFLMGPLEWVWRTITWRSAPPMRARSDHAERIGSS